MRLQLIGILSGLSLILSGTTALSLTKLEESTPPAVQGKQLLALPGSASGDTADASSEPLGVNIIGIKIIDRPDELRSASSTKGVDVSNIDIPNGVNLDSILAPYVGKPISFKVLLEMRDDILKAYRSSGRAFVAATIPPQEISGGIVQIIVTESVLEAKKVAGTVFSPEDYILDNISAQEGETVDTSDLISDLNWLNLNPYRNLGVVAEPGKEFAHTILTFKADEQKPWNAYGGYNNHGTSSTNEHRMFAGVHVANLPAIDHQLSYQLTTSPEAFARIYQPLTAAKQAAYLSHDAYYFIPLSWRHKVRFRGAYIQTRSNLIGNLVSDSDTTIFSAEYAVPVKGMDNLSPEFYAKYERKNSVRDIYSAGVLASRAEIDVNQFLFGLRGNATDQYGRTNFNFRVAYSPGGLSAFDNAANYAAYSGDVNADAKYTYVYAHLQRSTPLGESFNLVNDLSAQWSNEALPSTEGFGVGGASTVRGYASSEVSGDRGIILRNEVHFNASSKIPEASKEFLTGLDLFAFADTGFAKNFESGKSQSLSSVGLGLNATLGKNVTFSSSLGVALTDTTKTKNGDVRAYFNLSARF